MSDGILGKIFTSLRGQATNVGQAYVDKNIDVIIDQEIRDAKTALAKATDNLTNVMANRTKAAGELKDAQAAQETCHNQLQQLAGRGADQLQSDVGRALAERYRGTIADVATKQGQFDSYDKSVNSLKADVSKLKDTIEQLERRAEINKANASVVQAREAASTALGSSKSGVSNALDSLQRAEDRTAHRAAQLDAAEELQKEASGSDLDSKLAAMGIGNSATPSVDDILAQFGNGAAPAKS